MDQAFQIIIKHGPPNEPVRMQADTDIRSICFLETAAKNAWQNDDIIQPTYHVLADLKAAIEDGQEAFDAMFPVEVSLLDIIISCTHKH